MFVLRGALQIVLEPTATNQTLHGEFMEGTSPNTRSVYMADKSANELKISAVNSVNTETKHAKSSLQIENDILDDPNDMLKAAASINSNLTSKESLETERKSGSMVKSEKSSQVQIEFHGEHKATLETRDFLLTMQAGDVIDPSVFDCNRIHIKANKMRNATI